MTKFSICVFVLTAAVVSQGAVTDAGDASITAALQAGDWNLLQDLLKQKFEEVNKKLFSDSVSIRDLKPPAGGKVYGESEFTFHSASSVNGKTLEDSAGHKVINDNGKVTEFHFKPTFRPALF